LFCLFVFIFILFFLLGRLFVVVFCELIIILYIYSFSLIL
jgi:hypothetical protein